MFTRTDNFAIDFSHQHTLYQCHSRPQIYNLQRNTRQPRSTCFTNLPFQVICAYFTMQLQDITCLRSFEIRHVESSRRAKSGPEVGFRNRQQSPARVSIVHGSLCASGVLLIDIQIFLLYRESPDELAASVLSTLRCYEAGFREPARKILIGIELAASVTGQRQTLILMGLMFSTPFSFVNAVYPCQHIPFLSNRWLTFFYRSSDCKYPLSFLSKTASRAASRADSSGFLEAMLDGFVMCESFCNVPG